MKCRGGGKGSCQGERLAVHGGGGRTRNVELPMVVGIPVV